MIPSYPRLRLLLRGDAAARFVFSDAGFWLDGAARTLNVHAPFGATGAFRNHPLISTLKGRFLHGPPTPLGLAPRGVLVSRAHATHRWRWWLDRRDKSTSGGVCRVAVSRDLERDLGARPGDHARRSVGRLVRAQIRRVGYERVAVGGKALGESDCDPQGDLGGRPQKLDEHRPGELEGHELGPRFDRGAPRAVIQNRGLPEQLAGPHRAQEHGSLEGSSSQASAMPSMSA